MEEYNRFLSDGGNFSVRVIFVFAVLIHLAVGKQRLREQ